VCDFVRDEFGNAFMVNCRSFKLADAEIFMNIACMDPYAKDDRKAEIKGIIKRAN
jgi:hypothetical protein